MFADALRAATRHADAAFAALGLDTAAWDSLRAGQKNGASNC